MRTSSRRKLDVAMVIAGSVVAFGGGSAIGAAAGDVERMTSMQVTAHIVDPAVGPSQVREVIDWDFGTATGKHGIFRDSSDEPIDPQVSSPDAPDDLLVGATPFDAAVQGTRLRIGDPFTTVSGRHRYEISYGLDTIVDDAGALAWNAVGTSWPVKIEEASIEIVAPWAFENVQCFQGKARSTDPCSVEQPEPGRLVAVVRALAKAEGVTIRADRGAALATAPALTAPADPPTDPGAGLLAPAAVAALAALAGAAPASRLVRRAGRERVFVGGAADAAFGPGRFDPAPDVVAGPGGRRVDEQRLDINDLDAMATTEFAPPRGIGPAEGGVILDEGVQSRHQVAWLLTRAIDGSVDMTEDGKKITLTRKDFGDPAVAPLLNGLFGGRTEFTLGKYDKTFATGWGAVGGSLRRWATNPSLWDPDGDRLRAKVRLGGIAAIVVGALAAVLGAYQSATRGSSWLVLTGIGAVIGGAGVAALIRAWELRVRTPRGSALWLQIESFRRFLADSEAQHVQEAARLGVLREYTAWAVALGEVDHWAKSLAAAGQQLDPTTSSFVHMAPLLMAGTSSSATAPSSSSSGGFSGGGGVG
ncbi:MAG: DUF2207 domain-containing protein, partial [Acidimicrobiia bacterium]